MSSLERRLEIREIAANHTREEAIAVIASGSLSPNDSAVLSPEDEFLYRHCIARDDKGHFEHLERFMLSMYGRDYLESPELTEAFYRDMEVRVRHVGEIALFANLHNESRLSAVTIGFLGDTSKYPDHVRLSAESDNFNNTLGLSGLTRVRLGQYQRVVKDSEGQVDPLRSVVANTLRWYPFAVEHIKLHDNLRTNVERKDMRVGENEIKEWADAHPDWQKYVEGTTRAVQAGAPNPIVDFFVPETITDIPSAINNPRLFNNLLDFEQNDDL